MRSLIERNERSKMRFEAAIHGVELDGGAEGSGLDDDIHYDPTQGKGNSAWQQAQKLALQVNAKSRRN